MKPLNKKDPKRFEQVCSIIRKALHVDHLDREYLFENQADGNVASTHVFSRGWRLQIHIRPPFWTYSFNAQLKYLIHEHIHVCFHPYHQAVDDIETQWVPSHCSSQVHEKQHIAAEIVVDHLESVLMELLSDRFSETKS